MKRLFYLLPMIIAYQCDAAHCSGNNLDILFHYIAQKKPNKVKEYIRMYKISPDYFHDPKKMTAFGYAAQVGSCSVFKCLLKEGRKVNAQLKINEPINEVDGQELTALEVAEQFGHKKIAKLIQKEIDEI